MKLMKKDQERIRIRIGIGLMLAICFALTLSRSSSAVFAASGTTYTTDFPVTENPISEGGKWINGETTGIDWGNVQTENGNAYGVSMSSQYGDPTAVLSGSWGPDQTVQATVALSGTPTSCCHEVELRLRTTITAHSITGYEINCSVSGQGYMQVVRWNGPLASFTEIGEYATNCHNGDILQVTMIGSTITVYKNGSAVITVNDGTFTGGSPGMGFYDNSDSNWSSFAFANFTASDTTTSPPPSLSSPTATLSERCFINDGGNIICTFAPANMPSQTVITVTGSGGGASVTRSVTLP